MRKRATQAAVAVAAGLLATTGAFFACSSSNGVSSPDAAIEGGKDAGVDRGIAVFEATVPDTLIRLPDTSVPDTGTVDAPRPDVAPPRDGGGVDHSVPDAPHTDAPKTPDSGVDAPKPDTGACVAVGVPSSTAGASSCPAPVTNTCGPASLSGYNPEVQPSTGLAQGKCTMTQIQSIYTDCFTGTQACPEEDQGNAALPCYTCIFSSQSDFEWGPVVLTPQGIANVNEGGCLQLLEPCNAPCAQALQDTIACDQQACGVNCAAADNDAGTLGPFTNCTNTVNACYPGGCYQYNNGATCAESIVGSEHPGSVCFQSDFETAFLSVSQVFCGN